MIRNIINERGGNVDGLLNVSIYELEMLLFMLTTALIMMSQPQEARHIHPSSSPCMVMRIHILIADVARATSAALPGTVNGGAREVMDAKAYIKVFFAIDLRPGESLLDRYTG